MTEKTTLWGGDSRGVRIYAARVTTASAVCDMQGCHNPARERCGVCGKIVCIRHGRVAPYTGYLQNGKYVGRGRGGVPTYQCDYCFEFAEEASAQRLHTLQDDNYSRTFDGVYAGVGCLLFILAWPVAGIIAWIAAGFYPPNQTLMGILTFGLIGLSIFAFWKALPGHHHL